MKTNLRNFPSDQWLIDNLDKIEVIIKWRRHFEAELRAKVRTLGTEKADFDSGMVNYEVGWREGKRKIIEEILGEGGDAGPRIVKVKVLEGNPKLEAEKR